METGFAQIVEKKKILCVFIKIKNMSEDNVSHAKKKDEIYIYIGCRAILYSLLLRTAPSHLQLLYECVCCRKIVICVCDREKKCASAFAYVDDADGAKKKKIRIYIFLFSILHIVSSDGVTTD